MARVQYSDIVFRNTGKPHAGAVITIAVHPGSAGSSSLWKTEEGSETYGVLVTNENGFFQVWLDEGRYDVSTPSSGPEVVDLVAQASVGAGGIPNEGVTAEKIATGAVTGVKIAEGSITESKIGAEQISKGKLTEALAGEVAEKGSVGKEAITAEKIAPIAVTSVKIKAEAVTAEKIASASITESLLNTALKNKITGAASSKMQENEQTANYAAVLSDVEKMIVLNKATGITLTINKATFEQGQILQGMQLGAGQVTIAAGTSMTLRGSLTTRAQYSGFTIWFRTSSEAVVFGDLT